MKKVMQFKDALGNIIQYAVGIDTFKQVKNQSYWVVVSRKIFPQATQWSWNFTPFENKYFSTEEEAFDEIKKHLSEYAEKWGKINIEIKEEYI